MDPLERLAGLRRVFFTGESAAGNRRLPGFVSQDSADGLPYPENARFELGSVGGRDGAHRRVAERHVMPAHSEAVEARLTA